jgi:ribulose 1,5-bisphosphate synthetase/thiazole synthase
MVPESFDPGTIFISKKKKMKNNTQFDVIIVGGGHAHNGWNFYFGNRVD